MYPDIEMAAPAQAPSQAPAAAPKVTIPLSDMEIYHQNEKTRQEYERARMLREIAEAVCSLHQLSRAHTPASPAAKPSA